MQDFDAPIIREYIADLQRQKTHYQEALQKLEQAGGLSPETIKGGVQALRVFFNWFWNEYDLPPTTNPMEGQSAAAGQPQTQGGDHRNIVKLLNAAEDIPQGRQDQAMVAFLAETGCRADGMLSLALENLHIASA